MVDRYVDFTATNNGDGTTSAQASTPGGVGAFNRFDLTDYPAGSVYNIWMRRAGSYVIGSNLALNQADIHMIGWPILGDPDYHLRPSVPTWDADTNTYAELDGAHTVSISTASGQQFKRIKFNNTSLTASVACEFNSCSLPIANINAACYLRDVTFEGSVSVSANAISFGCIANADVTTTSWCDLHFASVNASSITAQAGRVTIDTLVQDSSVSISAGASFFIMNGAPVYTATSLGSPGLYNGTTRVHKWGKFLKSDNVRNGSTFSLVGTYLGQLYRHPVITGEDSLCIKLAPGTRTITMFYTTLTDDCNAWFTIEYFDAGSGLHKAVASSYLNVNDDHSSWLHPGTFIKKTQVTISVGQHTLAPVRIFLREGAQTLTYIDPQLVVT